jgi:hypothetical protein
MPKKIKIKLRKPDRRDVDGQIWLRHWHALILRECGTDDVAVLIEAMQAYRLCLQFRNLAKELQKWQSLQP